MTTLLIIGIVVAAGIVAAALIRARRHHVSPEAAEWFGDVNTESWGEDRHHR